jgi:excisionase family DNA binding protein
MRKRRADEYFTPQEVADKLKVSHRTIKKYLIEGRLQGMKVNRMWRITPEQIQDFVAGRVPPTQAGLDTVNAEIKPHGNCTRPAEQDQRDRYAAELAASKREPLLAE